MSDRIRLTPAMRDLLLEIWQNGSAYPLGEIVAKQLAKKGNR